MFGKVITKTPFVLDSAEDFFPSVRGASFSGDVSFVSTLRALMIERPGSSSMVCVKDAYSANFSQLLGSVIFSPDFSNDSVVVVKLRGHKLISEIDTRFADAHPEFRELADLKRFVASYMTARFYINEESHKTIIFVEDLDVRRWHLLQALIPRYFPWIFQDSPLSDEERKLLLSLTHKYSNDYERIITDFGDKIDYRSLNIQKYLENFEQNSNLALARECEARVEECMNRMREILDQYDSWLRLKEEAKVKLYGYTALAQACEEKNSELTDYFKCNKSLIPVYSHDTSFSFVVNTYLESYDPEMYEVYSKNPTSHLYEGYRHPEEFQERDNIKLFLDAIFSEEPLLKVRTCAYFEIDIRGEVDSRSDYSFPPQCRDRIPNPHLQYFDCLGNYHRHILECLNEGNVVGAVEQCVASAKSVNIAEGVTMKRFLMELMGRRDNVIELPDGSLTTAVNALAWLKKNQNNEEEGSHGETDCADE